MVQFWSGPCPPAVAVHLTSVLPKSLLIEVKVVKGFCFSAWKYVHLSLVDTSRSIWVCNHVGIPECAVKHWQCVQPKQRWGPTSKVSFACQVLTLLLDVWLQASSRHLWRVYMRFTGCAGKSLNPNPNPPLIYQSASRLPVTTKPLLRTSESQMCGVTKPKWLRDKVRTKTRIGSGDEQTPHLHWKLLVVVLAGTWTGNLYWGIVVPVPTLDTNLHFRTRKQGQEFDHQWKDDMFIDVKYGRLLENWAAIKVNISYNFSHDCNFTFYFNFRLKKVR